MTESLLHALRPGGVMRCCIGALEERIATGEPPWEGENLRCDSCSSGLTYRDGAWEWDRT